jgi:hypothetical protein
MITPTPTPRRRRGRPSPHAYTVWTDGVDPMVVALRREHLAQGIANAALAREARIPHSRLMQIWRGQRAASVRMLRRLEGILQRGNPDFSLG